MDKGSLTKSCSVNHASFLHFYALSIGLVCGADVVCCCFFFKGGGVILVLYFSFCQYLFAADAVDVVSVVLAFTLVIYSSIFLYILLMNENQCLEIYCFIQLIQYVICLVLINAINM